MISAIVLFGFFSGSDALNLHAELNPDRPVDFTHRLDGGARGSDTKRIRLVRQIQDYTFEQFMADYGKEYTNGTPEYKKRAAIFFKRKAETIRLAGLPSLTWTPSLNHLMDQTKPEIKARLGYRPSKGRKSKRLSMARKPMEEVPKSFTSPVDLNWVPNMTYSVDFQKDQGACGSCWATATAAAVEAHMDVLHGFSVPLSAQQLVSCTANPKHCGGKGGCEGATAELALDYAAEAGGMAMEKDYTYTSMWGDSGACLAQKTKAPAVLIGGYTAVPANNYAALMYAAVKGPVIVAVDASAWSFYGAGIFNSCKRDATLNHAVLLVGYGVDDGKGYWYIRNSWGKDWGIHGYIKLSRDISVSKSLFKNKIKSQKTASFCGMDYHPEEGSACDGETDPVKVCGMCGVLYEPVLPIVTGVNKPPDFEAIIAENKRMQWSKVMKARREQQMQMGE